jgi:hypothetical protein
MAGLIPYRLLRITTNYYWFPTLLLGESGLPHTSFWVYTQDNPQDAGVFGHVLGFGCRKLLLESRGYRT